MTTNETQPIDVTDPAKTILGMLDSRTVPERFVHRCQCGVEVRDRGELCPECSEAESGKMRAMLLAAARGTLPAWTHARMGTGHDLGRYVDRRLLEGVRDWSAFGGLGLVLLGDTGTGKTTLAVAMMAFRLDQAKTADQVRVASGIRFVSVPELQLERDQQKLGTEGDGPLMRQAKASTLLVLDEVGFEHDPRAGIAPVVFDVAQWRYRRTLPTIVTSGLTELGLVSRYGDATKRRLTERAKVVTAFGVARG